MYLFNQTKYGNIVQNSDIVLTPSSHSTIDWTEDKILHPDFYDFLYNNNTNIFSEIGPDIWSIPFFTPEFCKHLIELSEEKGEWSAGVYADPNQTDTRVGKIEEIRNARFALGEVFCHKKTLFDGRGGLGCHGENHGNFSTGIVANRALHV